MNRVSDNLVRYQAFANADLPMPRIDSQRLLADLNKLSAIGRFKTGVDRPDLFWG